MPELSTFQMTSTKPISQQLATPENISIERLVGEFYPYIHRLACSILDDSHEAEDAAQETFVAANRSLAGFRAEAEPKTWLTAIAVNICRARLRKRKFHSALITTLQAIHLLRSSPSSPEQAAIQSEADQSIWQAVSALDEKHRIPVILRYAHALSVPEIAEILHLSQGTVHSRLHYARQDLHAQLGHLNPYQELPDEAI
jgi:RNA polymerase sigma-70 factor (ECF subfamily)